MLLLICLLLPLWGQKCFAGCLPEQLNGHCWWMGHKCELCPPPLSLHIPPPTQAAVEKRKRRKKKGTIADGHWCCWREVRAQSSLEDVLANMRSGCICVFNQIWELRIEGVTNTEKNTEKNTNTKSAKQIQIMCLGLIWMLRYVLVGL